MSQQDIDLRIKTAVDDAQSAKTIGELKKSLKELNSLGLEFGETSPEAFLKVNTAAAQLKDKIDDVREATNAIKGDSIEQVGGSVNLLSQGISSLDFGKATTGVQLLTSSIKNFNPSEISGQIKELGKSVLDLGKSLLQSLGDGLKERLGSLKDGFGQFGGAMKTAFSGDFKGAIDGIKGGFQSLGQVIKVNPIFLLATIVAIIISKFDELKEAGGLVGGMFKAIGEIIGFVTGLITKFTDAIGLTNVESQKQSKKFIEDKDKEKDAVTKRYDTEIALAKVSGRNTIDLEIQKTTAVKNATNEQINNLLEIKRQNGSLTDDQKKKLLELTDAHRNYVNQVKILEAQKRQAISDSNKKLDDLIVDLTNKTNKNKTQGSIDQIKEDTKRRKEAIDKEVGDSKKKEDAKALIEKDGQRQVTEIQSGAAKERQSKAEAAASRSKALSDKRVNELKTQTNSELAIIVEQGNVILSNDNKVSQDRLNLLTDNLDKQIQFYKDNQQKLGITDVQRDSQIRQLTDKKKGYEKEYNDYVRDLSNRANTARIELDILQAKSDDELLAAKIRKVENEKEIQLQNEKATADERQLIILNSENAITSLKNDFSTKRQQSEFDKKKTELDNEQAIADAKAKLLSGSDPLFTVQKFIDAENTRFSLTIRSLQLEQDERIRKAKETGEAIEAINREFDERETAAKSEHENSLSEIKRAAIDKGLGYAQAGAGALNSLGELVTQSENQRLKKGEKASLELQKRQFKRQKAFAIVNALIGTAGAVVNGLNTAPFFPVGIIMGALAGVTGAIQIATIASKQFNPEGGGEAASGGGGGASIPSMPSISDSSKSSSGSTQAPQFFGLGGMSQLSQDGKGAMGGGKVYVLEKDISDAQSNKKVIVDRATFK